MIASVAGKVAALLADAAVIEVGGVGLSVHCAPGTLANLRVGATARLATTLVVREDSLTLYGFADDDEKHLFELLQTASGVGPKLAQSILAVHAPDVVRKALAGGDIGVLTQVPGVGKKGAERLILELRDKVGPVSMLGDGPSSGGRGAKAVWPDQVRQALIGLGWNASQAESAVTKLAEEIDFDMASGGALPGVPILLKRAIRMLGTIR